MARQLSLPRPQLVPLSWVIFLVQLLELISGCAYTGWSCWPVGEGLQSTTTGVEDMMHFQGVLVQPHAAPVPWAGCRLQWESRSLVPPGESPVPVLQDYYSACQSTASGKARLSSWLVSHINQIPGLDLPKSPHAWCLGKAGARLYWANSASYNMHTRLTLGQCQNSPDLDTGFELNCMDVNLT